MDVRLSPGTRRRVDHLFSRRQRDTAARLLVEECGTRLPACGDKDRHGLERIRFAALKMSGGNLERLRAAVDQAKTDWRDLLVQADFAHDIHAHERWPEPVATR